MNSSQTTTVNRHMRGDTYAADEELLRAFRSLWRLLQRGTSMVGRGIFRSSDYQARQHGWQIIARHGGLSRTYRDQRFDYLTTCTTCSGHGRNLDRVICPDCRTPGKRSRLPRSRHHFHATPGTDMNRGRGWDRDYRVPIGVRRALGEVATPNPLVASWRWRWEIALLAGLAAMLVAVIISLGVLPTIAVVTVITVTVMGVSQTRQLVFNRAWCIITAHRVRVGCAEAMIYSSRGKIPVILWTTHEPFGERVLLWCRAGTSVDDFVLSRAMLTSTCWAHDIAVFSDIRWPHLAILDVIRRPAYGIPDELGSNRDAAPPGWSQRPVGEGT